MILALLPDSLGDLLLTTPSLKALDNGFPDEEKIWLVPDPLLPASKLIPLLAQRLPLSALEKRNGKSPDITVCFPPATRYYRMARRIGGEKRAGYVHEKMWVPRLVSKFSLTHRWICPARPVIHEMEAYGKIVELLGIGFEPDSPLIEIPESALLQASGWLESRGVSKSEKIIGVHLNSKWPESPLKYLTRGKGSRVLALFGGDEEKEAKQLIDGPESSDLLIPGPQNLPVYAAFLKHCSVLVAADGGPVHLASAAGTPVIAFYPDDNFEVRVLKWHPWRVRYRALPMLRENLRNLPDLLQSLKAEQNA